MFTTVFTTFIVQPLFNLLVLIYNLIPGHNFGLAIIIFTVIIRLLLWPLVKKQLHQTKLMRQLQPEIKRIRQETTKNGVRDRQKESLMTMELYKERGVSVFSSIQVMLLQLPVLIGLYVGLRKILDDPHQIVTFSYPFIQHFAWMKHLASNIHLLDTSLFHIVNLTRAAISPSGVYWPAMVLVLGSAVIQYYQSKQLLPTAKDSRSLRQILKEAGSGKQADQSEVNEAVGRSTRFLLPVMVFLFTVQYPSALSLYWLVSGLVAFWQQSRVIKEDVDEMEALVDKRVKPTKKVEPVAVKTKPSKAAKPSGLAAALSAAKSVKVPRRPSGGSTVSRVIIDGEVVSGKVSATETTSPTTATIKRPVSKKSTKASKSKKRRK